MSTPDTNNLPAPLTPAARRERRHIEDARRRVDLANRETSAVLQQMYRNCLRGRRG